MNIYLDTCVLHRLFDDRSQPRIAPEAEAVTVILRWCEEGTFALVSSDVLSYEVSQNPNLQIRTIVTMLLSDAKSHCFLSDDIEARARHLENEGFAALDELRLASAEASQADIFCTCDDRFLKKITTRTDLTLRCRTPLELITEVQK